MYISSLLIDVGDNPDRPRPGHLWLRNLYHVHQRLCMAFPSEVRKSEDENFLRPFKPDDFGKGQVHVKRADDVGFLFRIDPQMGGRVVIIVQSAAEPNWDYAFHNSGYLLAAPPQMKPFVLSFKANQRFRFRLVANATRRLSNHSFGADGQPEKNWANKTGKGKRVPVPYHRLLDWLAEWRLRRDGRDEPSGFCIEKDRTTALPGYIYFKKPKLHEHSEAGTGTNASPNGEGHRLFSVRYEGILEVTDPAHFCNTFLHGIGPGKAFGFGLLSIAPSHPSLGSEAH